MLGLVGRYPLAGVAWQALHHLVGFEKLGLECWYLERTGAPPYAPREGGVATSAAGSLAFLDDTLPRHGFAERWGYWDCLTERWHGPGAARAEELIRDADVLVNLCGAASPEVAAARRGCLVYVETDPVYEQVRMAEGDAASLAFVGGHDVHFTYGVRIGDADCPVPAGGVAWRRTHPPVVVDLWQAPPPRPSAPWRSVSTWRNRGKDVVLGGRRYHWSKHPNYERVLDLPRHVDGRIELALSTPGEDEVRARFAAQGWELVDPLAVSSDVDVYRRFVQESGGELSVEKEDLTELRPGWFSDRSVCFLAAGRPCVLQDTGFGARVPVGEGLLAWRDREEAVEAMARVAADRPRHARAALRIAREHFEARVLLPEMLDAAGVGAGRG